MLQAGISIKFDIKAMAGVVALAIAAGVIFISCGGEPAEPTPVSAPTVEPTATLTPVPTPTLEPTATPTPTAAPEPTVTPEPTIAPEPTATPAPTAIPTAAPTPTATPEPTTMPMPVPTATPEPMTLSQEEVDKLLEGLDVNSIIENTIAAIEENPIFRAVRTQTLRDGGIEIFDTLYEYTGDYDAPYTAQGTHLTPSIGRIYEFDSTWRSTCVRKIAPSVERRLYYEHDDWWKIGPNAERLVPPIPFFPLIPNFGGWEAVDLHRQSGPLELVLRTVLPNGLSYTVHIYPEAHPFRVVVEKSYFGDRLLSDTTYFYDTEEGPVVHESEKDCLSRNAG